MMRMLFFLSCGALSAGAFVRWGFRPLGLLSVGGFCPVGLICLLAKTMTPPPPPPHTFTMFDFKDFYPSIKKSLLREALNYAKARTTVRKKDMATIFRAHTVLPSINVPAPLSENIQICNKIFFTKLCT